MKNACYKLIVIMIVLCFCGCGDDEDGTVSFPSVKTRFVEVSNIGGAIFSGEITKHEIVSDYGFIYGEDSTLKAPFATTVSLGKPLQSGIFEHDLSVGLKKDQVYFFKAYIVVNSGFIYGETKSFISNGSIPPVIESVSPEKGYLEQAITIYGKNFGTNNYYTTVNFGEIHVYPLYVNDTVISVVIPDNLTNDHFQLVVKVYDKSIDVPYQLQTPEIHSISPESGTFRDIISIQGDHFDTIVERNQVWLGEIKATVISSSRTEIKLVIPDDLQNGQTHVKLRSQLQEVVSVGTFSLKPPAIYGFPECTSSDISFEIEGEFFNPDYYRNRVFFGEVEANILGGDAKRLLVAVPYGPFPGAKTKVKVRVADIVVEDNKEICIQDNWVMVSNSLPFAFYREIGTFSLLGKAYVISRPDNHWEMKKYFWVFDPDHGSWSKTNLPFDGISGGVCTDDGEKGYVYNAGDKDNFWEYNPLSKQWLKMADFPGERRGGAAIFSIGDHVFLGIGSDINQGTSKPFHDFFRFDKRKNEWSKISNLVMDPHFGRLEMSVFVIGSYAYLLGGALNTGQNDVWRYNAAQDTWERVADAPDAFSMTSHFVLNGKGYIANGIGNSAGNEVWEYDPSTNTWRDHYSMGHYGRYGGFAFVVNGKAYAGGGATNVVIENSSLELYQLNK
jgi:N-acetylneuraminic acid mutarotase